MLIILVGLNLFKPKILPIEFGLRLWLRLQGRGRLCRHAHQGSPSPIGGQPESAAKSRFEFAAIKSLCCGEAERRRGGQLEPGGGERGDVAEGGHPAARAQEEADELQLIHFTTPLA